MHKNQKVKDHGPKKLTVEDLKRVIGGLADTELTVEGSEVEDTSGNKGSGTDSKAS